MEKYFKKYNNCLISRKPPHNLPNVVNIKNEIKKEKAYLARWVDEWDCPNETNFWYVIKDSKYDYASLNSHDRNVINNGKKHFDVAIVNFKEYSDSLYDVYIDANNEYSNLTNTIISKEEFCKINDNNIFIAAFDKKTKQLSAYVRVVEYKDTKKTVSLSTLCSLQSQRRKNVNAALMDFICNYYMNEKCFDYIYDGARSIRHISNFQDYLIKYFGFRKAYCKLNIIYSNQMKFIINFLYPFRNAINLIKNCSRKVYSINSLLIQESIRRSFNSKIKGDSKNV